MKTTTIVLKNNENQFESVNEYNSEKQKLINDGFTILNPRKTLRGKRATERVIIKIKQVVPVNNPIEFAYKPRVYTIFYK